MLANTLTSDGKPRLIGEDCENGPAFETGETCFCYILRMLMELKSSEYLDTRTDTLDPLSEASKATSERHLCEHCFYEVQNNLGEGLKDNWEELPKFFGLEGWEEIIDAQVRQDAAWDY